MRMLRSTFYQLTSWRTDLKVLMAFAFGIVLSCISGYNYLNYANFLRSDVQVFEVYIINGSTGSTFLGIFLGNILLMSNAPFVDEITSYEFLRLGKKRWVESRVIYIILGCFFYSFIILVSSSIFSFILARVYLNNMWSGALSELAMNQPMYAIEKFKVAFPYRGMISSINPYMATLLTVICNSLYSSLICMLIMCVNICNSHNFGWLIASIIHIGGYIIYANMGFLFPLKYSLFCHGMVAHYFEEQSGFSMISTISVVIIIFIVLQETSRYGVRKMEV